MAKYSRPVAAVLALCALALVAPPAAAQRQCSPVVEAELTKLEIKPDRRAEVIYARDISGGEGARVIGIDAWVYLKDCDGAVIIKMRPNCEFQHAYTIRSCKIPGVYHDC